MICGSSLHLFIQFFPVIQKKARTKQNLKGMKIDNVSKFPINRANNDPSVRIKLA